MQIRSFTRLSLVAMTAAVVTACGSDGGSDGGNAAGPKAVTLEFAAYAGATPVKCGTAVGGLGSGTVEAQIKDFRFYVSGVQMLKADGSKVPLTLGANDDWNLTAGSNAVTLIDLEDGTGSCAGTAATNAFVKGTVPAGDYVGVELTMGVPFALNHSDYATAPRPMDIQGMAWSWQSGRKFAKIEVTDPTGAGGTWTANTFNVHLGSTGCTGNPASGETVSCKAPNRMAFHFHAFDAATQKIAVDLRALLAGNDITRNAAGALGCMSGGTDPECQKVFEALAIDWQADGRGTGLPIDEGHDQTLFKVVAK